MSPSHLNYLEVNSVIIGTLYFYSMNLDSRVHSGGGVKGDFIS